MTDTAANKQTIATFFERFLQGGILAVQDMFTDDLLWIFPARSRAGRTLNLAQLIDDFNAMSTLFTGKGDYLVHGITAEGDRVAVEAESHFELVNGQLYNNLYHFLFILRDGKICQVKEYADTLFVAEALNT